MKHKQFWAGVVAGYLLLVLFPQLNVRAMAAGKRAGV